jgi:hypothetical protein
VEAPKSEALAAILRPREGASIRMGRDAARRLGRAATSPVAAPFGPRAAPTRLVHASHTNVTRTPQIGVSCAHTQINVSSSPWGT